jgi:hypothetical protein
MPLRMFYITGGGTLNKKLNRLVLTGILLAMTVVFQYVLRFSQFAAGPAVNAMLFLSTAVVGTAGGVIVGAFTPIIAFFFGIMWFPPMVPFIAIGNAILTLVYGLLRKSNEIGAYVVSVVAKFAWLALSVRYLLQLFGATAKPPLVKAMTFPQLVTGLLGALVAFLVLTILEKNGALKHVK